MMMLYRLVRMIETHSQSLAACLLERVHKSGLAQTYQNVPSEELQERVYEIYRHLGEWLIGKDESHLEQRYLQIGARRASQRVPLSEVIWVIVLTKENLWDFIKKEAVLERPVEVFGELEMLQLLEQFFDRAIYYAAVGYELAVADQVLKETSAPAEKE
ncbi:MAG TPA: hypothetical protein VE957_09785 [Terriglobales bacterium]|jgi:hypothetical protein|nr:hypothetical protein [Terriglobales bacterium]